jgi:hypothetical protein
MQATSWNSNYERTLLLKVNRAQGDAGSLLFRRWPLLSELNLTARPSLFFTPEHIGEEGKTSQI